MKQAAKIHGVLQQKSLSDSCYVELYSYKNLTKDARCLLGGFSMDAKAAARSGAR